MKRLALAILTTFAISALGVLGAAANETGGSLSVSVTPGQMTIDLGNARDLTVAVTNESAARIENLVVHLDITAPGSETSVDPEDWTPTLSRSLGSVQPGEQVSVDWTIAPISGGEFLLYAVAFDAAAQVALAVSEGTAVHVDERRSFNPKGVLPLTVGMPLLLGALLMWRRRDPSRPGPESP